MSDTYRWAVRDIRHGKTYYFRNWQDLVNFASDLPTQKPTLFRKENKNVKQK